MTLKNTKESYGVIARSFHWISAVLVLGMLVIGFIMVDEIGPLRPGLFLSHKTIGLGVLALTVLRLLWRRVSPQQALPGNLPRLQAQAAHASHVLLYALLLLLPLAGWAMVSASGEPPQILGDLLLPRILDPDPTAYILLKWTHRLLAFTLCLLLVVHIAAALYHGLVRRDGIFQRMRPW